MYSQTGVKRFCGFWSVNKSIAESVITLHCDASLFRNLSSASVCKLDVMTRLHKSDKNELH